MSTKTTTAGARTWPDLFLFAGAALLLWAGWQDRDYTWISAEQGFGYALGIIGGSMMLALLLYPLRKNARWMSGFGAVTSWFRAHMWLGVLGPVAVLYHANFKLGSLNSNVALFCMSVVALSGLVGRYFYTKVHRSLYTSKLTLGELRADLNHSRADLAKTLTRAPELSDSLFAVEKLALAPSIGILGTWVRAWRLRFMTFSLLRLTRHALREHAASAEELASGMKFVRAHCKTAQRIAEFSLYDRLLSLWHLLHLPLFLLLVVSGIFHVIAVHMY
jgi:hypothetical protein